MRRVGQLLDLEGQAAKFRCSSRLHPLAECRHRIAAGIPIGTLSIAEVDREVAGFAAGLPMSLRAGLAVCLLIIGRTRNWGLATASRWAACPSVTPSVYVSLSGSRPVDL